MRGVIGSVVVSIFLGGFTGVAAQLPPEIMADRYLVQVERLIAENDYEAALDTMNEIVALQITLPDVFHFKYAQVALGAGLNEAAIDSATKYLTTAGRAGEFYRDALELLDEAEAEAEAEARAARAREVRNAEARAAREVRDAEARAAREAREQEIQTIRAALERDIRTGIEFVRIPAGEFRMGHSPRPDRGPSTEPVTRVRINRAFDLGKYEVTQGQWEAVMGTNPSRFPECGLECPADSVSWGDTQEFIRRLNAMDGAGTYRLPTEAEWEYAARAGTTGDRYGNLDAIAWYRDNSGRRTHPVGQKAPNAWGLYDMLGNVYEWVADWYDDYPGGSVTDPQGPPSGSDRVTRGGSWSDEARILRAPWRLYLPPVLHAPWIGFRLLRTE